jgi:hypothetical protein
MSICADETKTYIPVLPNRVTSASQYDNTTVDKQGGIVSPIASMHMLKVQQKFHEDVNTGPGGVLAGATRIISQIDSWKNNTSFIANVAGDTSHVEDTLTSMVTANMTILAGNQDIHCVPQMGLVKDKIDFAFVSMDKKRISGIEWSVHKEKSAQCFAYGRSMLEKLPNQHTVLCAEILTSKSAPEAGTFTLYAYTRMQIEGGELRVGYTTLEQGALNNDSFARLLSVLFFSCVSTHDKAWTMSQQNTEFDLHSHLSKNVQFAFTEESKKTYKLFRHGRSSEFMKRQLEQRNIAFEEWKLGGKKNVLIHTYIEGDHVLHATQQALAIATQIHTLHQAGIVHGDLHEFNVVYSEDRTNAMVIDFDLSGKNGVDVYPANFKKDINFGKRHDDAAPGKVYKFAHDWFALHYVFQLYRPDSGSDTKTVKFWGRFCAAIRDGTFRPNDFKEASHTDLMRQPHAELNVSTRTGSLRGGEQGDEKLATVAEAREHFF